MEIKNTIKALVTSIMFTNGGNEKEALNTAITILEQQQQKIDILNQHQPCEHCGEELYIHADLDLGEDSFREVEKKYCRNCGRRLEDSQ